MSAAQETIRQARLLHGIFLSTVALNAYIAEMIARSIAQKATLNLIRIVFVAIAAYNIFLSTSYRKRLIDPALDLLSRDPDDIQALKQWQSGNIFTFCFCEVVGLLGLGLRLLGGTFLEASLFYLTSAALLVLWTPKGDFVRRS